MRSSFSHADVWKALISKYIVTIPLIGDTCAICIVSLPMTPVSNAIIANVGDAARASQSATLSTELRRVALPPDPSEQQ